MSAPDLPPLFSALQGRPFSFYPAIIGIEHNEFEFREANWSEILVSNTKSQEEIWIPRRFLAEVSKVDEPMMILGLNRELEYRMGQVMPHSRRVLEIPRANDPRPSNPAATAERSSEPARRSMGSGAEGNIGKMIMIALAVGLAACVVVIAFFRGDRDGSRVSYSPMLQTQLPLSGSDDYHDVVRKLGKPAEDVWRSSQGEMQYRLLRYPDKRLAVILMGAEREKALYVGALDNDSWRPVHTVTLPGGKDTLPVLRALRRF